MCRISGCLISRFIEHKKGKPRLPKDLISQDNYLWIIVYKLLCWERMSETDVIEKVRESALGKRDSSVIHEALGVIRNRYPDCGKPKEKEVHTENEIYSNEGFIN